MPIRYFFRESSQLTSIDQAALARCTGHVLDAGTGTGVHSLILQQKGWQVTDDASNLAYQRANQQAGRFIGEIRMQFESQGQKGPYCG